MLVSVARNVPPQRMHARLAFWGWAIPGVCGALLSIACMDYEFQLLLGEYAVGTTATALTWMIMAFTYSAWNRLSWMGASNGEALSGAILP
jgi:hypothetical protein